MILVQIAELNSNAKFRKKSITCVPIFEGIKTMSAFLSFPVSGI